MTTDPNATVVVRGQGPLFSEVGGSPLPDPVEAGGTRVRLQDVHHLFGVDQQTVYVWRGQQRNRLPAPDADGTYNMEALVRWGKQEGLLDLVTGMPVAQGSGALAA